VVTQESERPEVWLEPWSDSDLDLLRRNNAPEMMTYIGGPETEEQLVARHQRYLERWRLGTARMFRVVIPDVPQGVRMEHPDRISGQGHRHARRYCSARTRSTDRIPPVRPRLPVRRELGIQCPLPQRGLQIRVRERF
jgi:hypothetical protein